MGDTYVAGISDGNANVTMNIDITLDGLVIFGGVQLNTMIIPNSRILTIEGGNRGKVPTGFIDINDLLVLQATNNFTELKVVAGPSGSTLIIDSPVSPGEIRMSNNTGNRIYGATGTETIIFGADLTVRGSGDIGANLTTLINQGTIVADQSILLQIDPSPGGGMTNSGLMVARDGGLLLLRPGVYDNALGEIRAEDGSTVRFDSGAQITGGLMVAQSGGLFEFNGGTLLGPTVRIDVGGLGEFPFLTTSTIENLTNHGVINQINAATLHTAGQFNNTGTYFMNSINNLTDLILDSDTVLDGGGVINMSQNGGNRIYGATGTETFTNVDNTIRGSGDIGANLTTIINQGTIVADQSILLQIDPSPGGGMTNSGLMVARDGGLLLLRPGVYDNALGEIRAEDGSTVRFDSGAQITGGLMVAQSGGLFEFNGGTLLGPTVRIDVGGLGEFPFLTTSTIENLTNHGVINQINAATLHTAGQFNNTGTYFMNSINNLTDLILDSDTVLDGGGVINMSQNGGNRIYGATGTETFTNVDNTIRGSGDIGANLTTIINQGTIVADQSVELRIDPRTAGGGMTNSGTLRAENGAELQLYTGPFTTSGSVVATTGSTITRVATDYIQTAGSTIIDGVLTLNAGGTVTLDGGILGGSGQVNAHVNNVAGTASPGSSPGTLTVNGNYTQGIDASFAVEISGTRPGQFDVLAINGNATLAGTLEITFIDAFDPLVGQMFTVLTANNVSGEFDNIDSCAGISVAYNETSVVLTITSACVFCPWDLDDSGSVGTNDLLALFAQWGTAGSADFDESGAVGTSDLLILFANWGPCP